MNQRNHRNLTAARPGAFTLVEMILVLVILAILGAIAMPRYAGFTAQQEAEAAARRIISDLSMAQRRARQMSASQTVSFDVLAHTYSIAGMADPDHPAQPYVVRLSAEPYGARLVSAAFGGDASIVYDGFGTPDSSGQVVIAVGGYQKTIDVEIGTGRSTKLSGTSDPMPID